MHLNFGKLQDIIWVLYICKKKLKKINKLIEHNLWAGAGDAINLQKEKISSYHHVFKVDEIRSTDDIFNPLAQL